MVLRCSLTQVRFKGGGCTVCSEAITRGSAMFLDPGAAKKEEGMRGGCAKGWVSKGSKRRWVRTRCRVLALRPLSTQVLSEQV